MGDSRDGGQVVVVVVVVIEGEFLVLSFISSSLAGDAALASHGFSFAFAACALVP